MTGIYCWTNKTNGKKYIGQSINIEQKKNKEIHPVSHKANLNSHFNNAVIKDGWENFEFSILKECQEKDLNELEQFFIRVFSSWDSNYGYNKTFGGEAIVPTEETKEKMSISAKKRGIPKCSFRDKRGEKNPMFNKKHSEESKLSESKTKEKKKKENIFYGCQNKRAYHNPETNEQKYFSCFDKIPEGWLLGCKQKNKENDFKKSNGGKIHKDCKWWTDGKQNVFRKEAPNGFRPGMTRNIKKEIKIINEDRKILIIKKDAPIPEGFIKM